MTTLPKNLTQVSFMQLIVGFSVLSVIYILKLSDIALGSYSVFYENII